MPDRSRVQDGSMNKDDLTKKIREAFAWRTRPEIVADRSRSPVTDRQDAERLERHSGEELDWWFLQQNADALYAMTPEAFRYYLPEFMILGMAASEASPLFISPIFQMLDPGPDTTFWSDAFRRNWVGMNSDEYDALKAWAVFLASSNAGWVDDVVLSRDFDTLVRLAESSIQPGDRCHELP
jgi:hypothetical protein